MAPSTRAPLSKTVSPPLSTSRTRPRKTLTTLSSQKINTNPSAHPRTDPINALNVLVKLLTSLPSPTQAEHALSLHLINVLDPFVYHGVRALAPNPVSSAPSAPCYGLVNQPTEIIDAILHFDYRVIRCKISSISVWNHLVHHRSLARNVRKLEIIDERASCSGSASGMLIPRGILQGDTDLESTDDELSMHAKQERFLAAALVRMTGLKEFKWSCNHSPISIAHVWPTLMMRAANLKSINICDNLRIARAIVKRKKARRLLKMESVAFRSTPHSYGSAKHPELARISAMLHQCVNLKNLEVTYIAPRSLGSPSAQGTSSRTRPLADEFFMYGRWSNLTTLTLTNLRCGTFASPSSFLSAHPALEVLHMDVSIHAPTASGHLYLADGALPRLREIKASKDIINAILECPSDARRPLESVKGFKLSGNGASASATQNTPPRFVSDATFLSNLKQYANCIRRIELVGWHDMEDVKKLTSCVPNVQHLDVGRRMGAAAHRNAGAEKGVVGPATNIIEWTELLATLPELVTMHGVKFFYEVSSAPMGGSIVVSSNSAASSWSGAPNGHSGGAGARDSSPMTNIASFSKNQSHMSMMERSRMRKNDEIAGVLAWKCPKLRRVDHWEEGSPKVIVLLKEHADEAGKERESKVRWEVRRMKQ
ncbi:hypothetical protein BDZ97DRAFT_1906380 [Flammula alnicola]|nr:hypothetical protein BDZ97DRAFT_1906380 [Flammula alnicola]